MSARRGPTHLPSPCVLPSSRPHPYRPATILHVSNLGKQIQALETVLRKGPPACSAGGPRGFSLAVFGVRQRRYALAPSAPSALAPASCGAFGGLTTKATTALPIIITAIM